MAIHRRFLYAGLFLVAVGGVLVTADITGVNEPWLRDALRLWPIALIAIGLAIVVRRTSVALPAGMLAAVAPGLLIGGSMVAGPRVAFACSDLAPAGPTFTQEGVLSPTEGTVSIATGCGTSTISTAPGTAWRITAASTDAREPEVFFDATEVSIESPARGGRQLLLGNRREDWTITLPSTIQALSLSSHANTMDVQLAGATIGAVVVEADAAAIRVDATGATIDELDVQADFGTVSIVLPNTPQLSGYLNVDVGALRLCQPVGADMTVAFQGDGPREVSIGGQPWSADQWTSQTALGGANQIDLVVDATFGSVDINPIGGC